VGISRDSPYSHLEWAKRLGLNFRLLSDWNAQAVRAFGVTQEMDGLKDTPMRAVFLADAGGTIRTARLYDTDEVPDMEQLLADARGMAGS
jgi:peroxiredoxin